MNLAEANGTAFTGTGDEVPEIYRDEMLARTQSYLCLNKSLQNIPLCRNVTVPEGFAYDYIVQIVVPIIFGFVVLVGVFGNTLVVIVIIINKQMRSTTNYLIFSLAIADLLFTVFCVPFTASDYIFDDWPFGSIWCKVVQYLTYVTAYASVYTLLLLSIDRYLAVVHPIYAISIRTDRNAIYAILFTWTLILTSCIPIYVVHGLSPDISCTYREEYNHAAFHIGFFTTMYLIPLILIVALYLKILKRLWSKTGPGGTRSAESVRGKKRVTRMVVIVVVTFIICWMPIQVVLVLKSLGHYKMTTPLIFVQIIGQVLAYMNSCVNPILYAFLSDPFRKAFHKVISCGPSRRQATNGRLTCEATRDTRPLNHGQSIRMSTVGNSPYRNEDGVDSSTQRLLSNDRVQRYPIISPAAITTTTTTTSFMNESRGRQESPTPSVRSNSNCSNYNPGYYFPTVNSSSQEP